jgi:phage baseplate assembly protein W
MSNKYGNDLILFDGDLSISAKGDLASTNDYEKTQAVPFAGYYNIIFSVFNRINTVTGELPIHPTYGSRIPAIVSTPAKQEFIELLRQELSEALLQDPRVSEVLTTNIIVDGSKVSAKSEVVLTGRSDSSVFIFPNFYIE